MVNSGRKRDHTFSTFGLLGYTYGFSQKDQKQHGTCAYGFLARLGDQFIGIIVAKSFGGRHPIPKKPASSYPENGCKSRRLSRFRIWDVFFFPGRTVSFREGNSKWAEIQEMVLLIIIFHGRKCQFKGV